MNCNDYLSMLATLPVDELAYGNAREHVSTCHDCDRVTRVVVERERNMRLAFDQLQSSMPATQTAIRALEASRRRRIARYYEVALGVAMAATLVAMVALRRGNGPMPVATVTETFRLQCLSPEQAAEVVRPFVSSAGEILIPPTGLGIIDIRASLEEVQKARSALDRYDNPRESQCAVRIVVPKVR